MSYKCQTQIYKILNLYNIVQFTTNPFPSRGN